MPLPWKGVRKCARLALVCGFVASTVLSFSESAAAYDPLAERVQLRRNAARGLEYVPTSTAEGSAGTRRALKVVPKMKVNIDGNALDNTYSSLLPLDFNGNGTSEYLMWNGHKTMRVYGRAGNKVWELSNPSGRALNGTIFIHRDQAAVLDLNADMREDILHCWQSGSTKKLIERNGATGKELRSVTLAGQSTSAPTQYCRIAVYYKESDHEPIILVSHSQSTSGACGGRNYTDNWARVVAFDKNLNQLWSTNTCDAGHVTAGVDANQDGYFDYVFVGKYALDFNGKIRCTLSGWNSSDHVDAVRVAKVDPGRPGLQVVAVGRTGGGMFEASTCSRIWTVPVTNPQEMAVFQMDPAPAPLSIMVTNRGGSTDTVVTTVLNYKGQKIRTIAKRIMPMQNAQLDGYVRDDEIVGMFGEVFNGKGDLLLSKDWYWNLKGTNVTEKPSTNVYDKWVAYPLLFDMDNDGEEELVTWGQSLIVEGEFQ
jgi:hypothetical protein